MWSKDIQGEPRVYEKKARQNINFRNTSRKQGDMQLSGPS